MVDKLHCNNRFVLSIFQEMQGRFEALQRELADQRDRDGGVFISLQQKEETERKIAELEQLRREHRELSVSHHHHYQAFQKSITRKMVGTAIWQIAARTDASLWGHMGGLPFSQFVPYSSFKDRSHNSPPFIHGEMCFFP